MEAVRGIRSGNRGFLIELEDRLVDFEDVEFKGIRKVPAKSWNFFMKNIPVHHF